MGNGKRGYYYANGLAFRSLTKRNEHMKCAADNGGEHVKRAAEGDSMKCAAEGDSMKHDTNKDASATGLIIHDRASIKQIIKQSEAISQRIEKISREYEALLHHFDKAKYIGMFENKQTRQYIHVFKQPDGGLEKPGPNNTVLPVKSRNQLNHHYKFIGCDNRETVIDVWQENVKRYRNRATGTNPQGNYHA